MLVVRPLPRISEPTPPIVPGRQLYMRIPQLLQPPSHEHCELNTALIRMFLQNLELSQYIEAIRC